MIMDKTTADLIEGLALIALIAFLAWLVNRFD